MGKSVCINLVEFKPVRFDSNAKMPEDLEQILIDCDLTVKKV
jgi:hypothetical protein